MTISKFIIVLLTISFLTSCRSTYRLSKNDYRWMPYKGNEILVFGSNTGDTDTIFFLKKDTLIAYPEAQSLNGITYEEVAIFCRHTDPSPPDGKQRYLDNYFVKIKKSKDRKARLDLEFSAKDAWFYRLDDVDWMNFKQRSNYITKAYWSKSEGLIRYDKQDSVYWELTKKYSP